MNRFATFALAAALAVPAAFSQSAVQLQSSAQHSLRASQFKDVHISMQDGIATLTGPAASAGPRSGTPVQRGCDRRFIDLASGVRWERLTPAADDRPDFLKVIYSPGGHSTDERRPLRHAGREYGLILSGTLRATVGFESYELNPGDSIVFDSSIPHEYWNTTDGYVHAVWVVVHAGGLHG